MKTATYTLCEVKGQTGRKSKPLGNPSVTGFRFREMRLSCGISVPVAAKELRVTERTIQNWETGRVRVPYAAYKLLRILRGWELPHADFKGWRLLPDRLVTPEGRAIWPKKLAWWSLTCRMADGFRELVAPRPKAGARVPNPQPPGLAPKVQGGLVHYSTSETPIFPAVSRGESIAADSRLSELSLVVASRLRPSVPVEVRP